MPDAGGGRETDRALGNLGWQMDRYHAPESAPAGRFGLGRLFPATMAGRPVVAGNPTTIAQRSARGSRLAPASGRTRGDRSGSRTPAPGTAQREPGRRHGP